MPAGLHDGAVDEDGDRVKTGDRREPVRDGNRRRSAALGRGRDAGENSSLGRGIQARRRFIREQQARPRGECARDRDALPLAPTQAHTALAHDRV